jgi:hypothetical protein
MPLYDLTKSRVKDDSGKLLDPFDYNDGVASAIARYSKVRPLELVADTPGSGNHDCDLPNDWLEGFSVITQVEYPVDRIPANIIDRADYSIYATPIGKKLRILIATPAADEMIRQTYTVMHTEATIPAIDLDAVASLAASICCHQLALAFGNTSDPTIQADSVNYRSKGDEYARRAKELEGRYKSHLGIKDGDTVAAASTTAPPPEKDSRPWHSR